MFAPAAKRAVLAAASIALLVAGSTSGPASSAAVSADRTSPTPPVSPRVTAATTSLVRITWGASRDDVGLAGYAVFDRGRRTNVSSPSYVARDVTCGKGIDLAVAAFDSARNMSRKARLTVPSGACLDTDPPSSPSGFKQVVTTQTGVVLSWRPSTDAVGTVAYGVYSNLKQIASPAEPSVTLSDLPCGSTGVYSIDAVDAADNRSTLSRVFVTTDACAVNRPLAYSASAADTWQLCAAENQRCALSGTREVRYGANDTWTTPNTFTDGVDCTNAVFGDPLKGTIKRCEQRIPETTPSPETWVNCAAENQRCAFSGTREVRYGANDTWTAPRTFTNGIDCTNGVFGDPLVGTIKRCERRSPQLQTPAPPTPQPQTPAPPTPQPQTPAPPTPQPQTPAPPTPQPQTPTPPTPQPQTPTPSPQTWVNCAAENQRCAFSGTREVRYGSNNTWTAPRTFTNGIDCTNGVFGDPLVGTIKRCEQRTPQVQTPEPQTPQTPEPQTPSPSPQTWVNCAAENQRCAFSGTREVRYGANNTWTAPRTFTNGIDCTNGVFGDPLVGTIKRCEQRQPVVGDTSPPTTPRSLVVEEASPTSVSLMWSPSTDAVGVAGYGTYRSGVHVASINRPGTTVTGLRCGTAETFQVDAFDTAGNRSSKAAVIGSTDACTDTQPPTAPADLVATSRTATSIALTWSPAADENGVTGYGIYRNGSRVALTSATTSIVSDLACDTNYTLAVDASDADGNRSAATTTMVATTACPDRTAPSTPTGLAASGVSQSGMTLIWNAANDDLGVTGYDVYRNATKLGTVTTTSTVQTGLACGTSYAYGVVARDAAGNSSQQAQLTAATAACSPAPQAPPTVPAPSASWVGDFRAGGQDFGAFDMHDARLATFSDPLVGQTKDVTILPKPAGSIYPWSNYMARVTANNSLPSNSASGQTVNLWQPGAYGQPWVRGNTVWCRVILVIPDGTDPRYPGKLTPVGGDGVSNSWHVLTEWHKNDGVGAPGPTSSKLEVGWGGGGGPALMFKPLGGVGQNVRGWYLYETDQVQSEANGAGGSTGPIKGNVVPIKFNHEYDLLFKWVLDPNPAVGRVEWYVDGKLRVSGNFPTMFQKDDGSVPPISFQAGLYRNYPTWAGNVTQTTNSNEHVYITAMLTGPTRASVGS